MAEITAAMVKALREETGQGMMECKKALQDANGDVEAARDLLRKKGLATAEKKAARVAKEGLIAIAATQGSAAMVEVNCETDFCARNDEFKKMMEKVAGLAAQAPDGDVPASGEITGAVQACFNKIGEKMGYRRGVKITAPTVGTYVHHNGKVAVVLGIAGVISDETLNDLCMHIAFADPMGVSSNDIPAEVVEKERKFATEQAVESGKPAQIVEKMVEGKIRKFLADHALLEQPFVKDEKQPVKNILGSAKVTAFARFAVGQ